MVSIYKYRPINNHTIHSLMYGELYFANPDRFNDPFDSVFSIKLPKVFYKNPINYVDRVLLNEYERINRWEAQRYRTIVRNTYKKRGIEDTAEYVTWLFFNTLKKSISLPGVFCASEICDSILMWTHYSNNHRGICIEYDAKKEPFRTFKSIKYTNEYYKFNRYFFFKNNKLIEPFLRKSKHWEYEREIRIFKFEGPGVFKYDISALRGIYFGCRCEQAEIDLVKLIMHTIYPSINFYKAQRSKQEYKVIFDKID